MIIIIIIIIIVMMIGSTTKMLRRTITMVSCFSLLCHGFVFSNYYKNEAMPFSLHNNLPRMIIHHHYHKAAEHCPLRNSRLSVCFAERNTKDPIIDATQPQQQQHNNPKKRSTKKKNHKKKKKNGNDSVSPFHTDQNPSFRASSLFLDYENSPNLDVKLSRYYMAKDLPLPTVTKTINPAWPTSAILRTIVDHLAFRNAPIRIKEAIESIEFYARTRKRLLGLANQKTPPQPQEDNEEDDSVATVHVVDCCAGHGLTGMLFAACNPPSSSATKKNNRKNIHVTLIDIKKHPSHDVIKNIIAEVCPWIETDTDTDKDTTNRNTNDNNGITFLEMPLESFQEDLRRIKNFRSPLISKTTPTSPEEDEETTHIPSSSQQSQQSLLLSSFQNNATPPVVIVIATHACGSLTDRVIDLAIDADAVGIAVMPCCYRGQNSKKDGTSNNQMMIPYGIKRMFGVKWAADISRSTYLAQHRYHTDFAFVPSVITPMNRILLGEKLS